MAQVAAVTYDGPTTRLAHLTMPLEPIRCKGGDEGARLRACDVGAFSGSNWVVQCLGPAGENFPGRPRAQRSCLYRLWAQAPAQGSLGSKRGVWGGGELLPNQKNAPAPVPLQGKHGLSFSRSSCAHDG